MTDSNRLTDLVARLRSAYVEASPDEAADALEARGKRIDELESRLLDKEARIALLEAENTKLEVKINDDKSAFRLNLALIEKQAFRIAELEALILDVHEDLCCQTNYDDKIGFDKLDAEVTKIKAHAAREK
jgi:cell division protein FtsB